MIMHRCALLSLLMVTIVFSTSAAPKRFCEKEVVCERSVRNHIYQVKTKDGQARIRNTVTLSHELTMSI